MKKSFLFPLVALTFTISCDKTSESIFVQTEQSKNLTADEIRALSWYNTDPRNSPEEATETAYVFNFGQEEGYAILSADKRTDKIFAIVPQGYIDFQEDVDESILSTGVIEFYANLEAAYDRQVEYAVRMQDSLISSALTKLESMTDSIGTKALVIPREEEVLNTEILYGPTYYVTEVAPLIKVRWGQSNPYDLYTPIITGTHAPTGCAATAVAQLMSYWRYPTSYNWDIMMPPSGNESLATFQTISHLMTDVGAGLNVQYGKKQSSAFFADIPGYLSGLGYNPGTYIAYKSSEVIQSLTNRRPVLIAGHSLKKDVYKNYLVFWEKYSHTYYEGGHAWLIDGYMTAMTPIYVKVNGKHTSTSYLSTPLVHCNWGWPELGIDGYYNDGSFNSNNGPVTRAHTETTGTEGNFQFNIECITNVYK